VLGIGLLTLVPGALGGTETYVAGLLRALAGEGELDYTVYLPPVAPDAAQGLPSLVLDEYRTARTIPERLVAMTAAAARPAPLRRRVRADAVHYPLTIALPRVRVPYAVTLQDVQHLDLPQLFSRAERAFRAAFWHRSIRGARLVVMPTVFSRDRAVERLGLDPARIRIVPHGIDHTAFRPDPDERDEPREPFLLYPAKAWPHKNHARLLEAFALLRRERPQLRLVLTGADALPAHDGVEQRGRVSFAELVSLYRRASALVFPSLYEGFGQPALEAMACGCPVAASTAGSLPEVCGGAARLFDPQSAQEIAAAVGEVLDDPEPWRTRGLARAAEFTWTASARGHEAAYRELLA
jgi:glycosyltransferase involved in cell wall biosynthesis